LWLILLAGDCPGGNAEVVLKQLAPTADGIICADGGSNHAYALEISPTLIVGDQDSLTKEVGLYFKSQGVEFIDYPVQKDYTDGEAAFHEALKRGAKEMIVFGTLGGRIDHTLNNLFLMASFSARLARLSFWQEDLEGVFCLPKEENFFNGQTGDTISLFALSPFVKRITLKNFIYPLLEYNLAFGSSRTMSNQLKSELGCVWFEEGILMALHYHRRIGGIE